MSIEKIVFLTFLAISLMVLGVHQLLTRDTKEVSNRMARLTARTFRQRIDQPVGEEAPVDSWRRYIDRPSKFFANYSISKKMEIELTKADIPLRGEEFVVLVLLATIISFLFFLAITLNLAFGVIAGILGLIVPLWVVRITRQKKLAKINDQIGDALLIMANSLRSGFSFLQAMDMVRKELPDPISKEFGRTFQEINLGTPAEDALQNMSQRVKSDDLDLVITAVLIQRQVGGNLAEILDNIADTIRQRIRIKGQIRTITAQGRISGWVIGMLPFALTAIIFVITPDYIMMLFKSKIGLVMVAAALFSEIIGMIAIKKIIDIEV